MSKPTKPEDHLIQNPKSKNKCKKCGSDDVYCVDPYLEHCRDCDNWQASF